MNAIPSLLESAQTPERTFAISKFMAMGVEWDRAAAALKQRDYAAFDRHMAKFNEIKDSNPGGGASNKCAPHSQ
jgi:hypothetical protein